MVVDGGQTSTAFTMFLHERSAGGVAHVTGSLFDHLSRTARLLKEWGNPPPICDAGLAHAVYGTAGYPPALLDVSRERGELVRLIGAEAEQTVYVYGSCDRARVYPQIGVTSPVMFHDRFDGRVYPLEPRDLAVFMELTFANELEIAISDAHQVQAVLQALGPLFARSRDLVSAGAYACFEGIGAAIPGIGA